MCEASAYILKDGEEELLLESVDELENEDGEVRMVSIFGEQKRIKARIVSLSLLDHKILLESTG
jgi:predicted RNA-binding protein